MTPTRVLGRLLRSPAFVIYVVLSALAVVLVVNITPWLLFILLPAYGFGLALVLQRTFRT
ncbi:MULTISPECIES: hypothetical protein [Pseudofrankia]|uniref:hypothetical protein n=1 Tax=Pseudofrankia TaxID=2994363 RepID=UPI000234CB1E|nr:MULTISPECIES: hypothetical protein [Pseudofrankia]OHV36394.1 hypothetical protein BCD49_19250 [Pseudofrankia sp. EUN1h]